MAEKEAELNQGGSLMRTEDLTNRKDAVCMISYETSNNGERLTKPKRGSGFYAKIKVNGVEHCCIVTNNHVIGCRQEAEDATVTFHYEKENQGIQVQLRPILRKFHTNKRLDYSVIGVDEDQFNRAIPQIFQIFPIEYSEQPQAEVGDCIHIFQHPKGEPKQFSNEKISRIEPPFVCYGADTKKGSSGSPVLWKLQLMAIHHTGNAIDGYNKGTLFSAIIDDLCTARNFNNPNIDQDVADGGHFEDEDDSLRAGEELVDQDIASGGHFENENNSLSHNSTDHSANLGVELAGELDRSVRIDSSVPIKEGCPEANILNKIALEVTQEWKPLGRLLLSSNAINIIDQDERGVVEKTTVMFEKWKKKKASDATYEALYTALVNVTVDRNDIAERFCLDKCSARSTDTVL